MGFDLEPFLDDLALSDLTLRRVAALRAAGAELDRVVVIPRMPEELDILTAGLGVARAAPDTRAAGARDGLRLQSEGIPLTWDDADLDRARRHITRPAMPRAGTSGGSPWARAWWRTCARCGPPVRARTSRGQAWRPADPFQARLLPGRRGAGLAGTASAFTASGTRGASRFAEATGDLVLLQALGGWSSLTLVQRHAHTRQERGAEAIRLMLEARGTSTGIAVLAARR